MLPSKISWFLALVVIARLWGQNETGQISGLVTDDGRTLPSVTITLKSVSQGQIRTIRTSAGGAYTIADLLPGAYVIEALNPAGKSISEHVMITAASQLFVNFNLGTGAVLVDSSTQGQQEIIGRERILNLPNLARNPYQFASLAGNVSEAGTGTRGAGVAINGQRESSTNILLDGTSNNNEFAGAIGQQIPLDAVQEFSVITSGFTAEYGRASGGIVNVISMSGSDRLHGTVYEFNRSSALTSNTFQNNAEGVREAAFHRNQFGYSAGGMIRRRKLYFFSSTEALLTRSDTPHVTWVPTPQLLALAAPNTQNFFQTLGQLRAGASRIGSIDLNTLTAASGRNPCTGLACATLPAGLPLFDRISYNGPADSAGGFPQNTVNTFERADYNLSDKTRVYARYALYRENDKPGQLSSSPYNNYDLGQSQLNNTFAVSVIHIWSPQWISETTMSFRRLSMVQQGLTSRGVVPTMYANPLAPVSIGTDRIAFPGYNPFTPGSGGAFGGPENVLQVNHGFSWTRGNHLLRMGGSFDTIRDNRTDASYQTAVDSLSNGGGIGPALNGLLAGEFAQIQVAIDPQSKFPCVAGGSPDSCTLTLPVTAPSFSRSNIYNEGSLYVQDYWKAGRRLSLGAGIRWEHFGVQHNNRPGLDSNWYAPDVGFADDNLGAFLRRGGLDRASHSSLGQLWKSDWKDFAPRAGFAWDIFGNGTTSIRGGYGIGYERNFGNVTFNVIQNLPNYAVLDVPGPVTTNNFGPLAATGKVSLPQVGARIINPNLKTAYAHFWNASIERRITRAVVYSLEYSGSKGVNLYSISYPNQYGFGNLALGDPCTGNGDCISQPNDSYGEEVGYRGNQGFSTYYGVNNRISVNNLLHSGISLIANYTWSHAVDNLSSTFFEAGGQGVRSQFGNQNITVNNGAFDTGLLDPYNPKLDKGSAEFDVRHRIAVAGGWVIPSWNKPGWMGAVTRGWTLNGVLLMRSGQPFSVFDTSTQTLDLNAPRATFTGAHPKRRNTLVAGTTPNLFHVITFLPAMIARIPNPLTPGSHWPAAMSARDDFRAPGFWNLDVGVHKNTKLNERFTFQIRGETFNILNHANLYVIGTSADLGNSNTVDACFGCTGSSYDRRQIQLAAKLIF